MLLYVTTDLFFFRPSEMEVKMEDPLQFSTTQTPLHIIPESILVKAKKEHFMDDGMTEDVEKKDLSPKSKLNHAYCLLCRGRLKDPSIKFHR